jgi:hypothetical protein
MRKNGNETFEDPTRKTIQKRRTRLDLNLGNEVLFEQMTSVLVQSDTERLSTSDLEIRLSINQINLFLIQLSNMGMRWTFIDIFHEFLKDIILALSFTLDLKELEQLSKLEVESPCYLRYF